MPKVRFIYEHDSRNPDPSTEPETPAQALQFLQEGNLAFSRWVESCRQGRGDHTLVVPAAGLGRIASRDERVVKQSPFAVVVGCSDARVPAEMIFGQGPNEMFVVRVAGNVLAAEGVGSVAYAVNAFPQVRLVVILGHTHCGAVTAAARAYQEPIETWKLPVSLRSVLGRISLPILESAAKLEERCGPGSSFDPHHIDALVGEAVRINARRNAEDLRAQLQRDQIATDPKKVGFAYGVFNLETDRVKLELLPESSPKPTRSAKPKSSGKTATKPSGPQNSSRPRKRRPTDPN